LTLTEPASSRTPRTLRGPPPELERSWFFSLKEAVVTALSSWLEVRLPTGSNP